MTEQETVNRLALLAGPRLTSLLRLRSVRHIYDPTPGALNATFVEDGNSVRLDKWKQASQPYRDIERFLGDDKVGHYIIGPGLLPIVTALSKAIMGKSLMVTRSIAAKENDKGVAAHLENFGVRITMHFDVETNDTILTWECLYGVA